MKYHNPRRNRFRSKDKGFRRSGYQDSRTHRIGNDVNNFQRKSFGRNDHNPEKLLEKYNNLAKEALSSGDKILSESYYQYADHFLRVVENRNSNQNNLKSHPENSSKVGNYSDKVILKDKENSSSQQSPNTEEI